MSTYDRQKAIQGLREKANIIEKGYWYRGNYGPGGTSASGNFTKDGTKSDSCDGGCLMTAMPRRDAELALAEHFGIDTNTPDEMTWRRRIFAINDMQSSEVGWSWSIRLLRSIADKLEREAEYEKLLTNAMKLWDADAEINEIVQKYRAKAQ